jgi:hypothetical protein
MTFPKVEFSEDERRTRYATFLLSMSSVAKRFPSFQREAVATILAPLKIFQVPMNRLKLVFKNMAAGAGSVADFLEPMLPFVLVTMLKNPIFLNHAIE